jgi:hypothetical protein
MTTTVTRNPQQLQLVKQLYEDGRLLAIRDDGLSLTKSVILLDLAVEQMLNTIIMDFTSLNTPKGKSGRKDIGWGDIWQRAADAMKAKSHELLNHSQLVSLHDVRNLAVHNGSIPAQGEVQRYLEPVEDMLTGVFQDAYSVDFGRFRLWDLILNDGLRQLLIDSENAHEKGHSAVCVVGCIQAHNLIINAVRELTRARRLRLLQATPKGSASYQSWPSGVPFQMVKRLEEATRQVEGELNRREANLRNAINELMKNVTLLEDELVTIGIGISVLETRRFQMIGDSVMKHVSYGRRVSVSTSQFASEDQGMSEGAQFMLNYLSRLIRLIQTSDPEVVGKIEVQVPLTSQHWWKAIEGEGTLKPLE